jgi:hypothetical protein
VELVARIEKTLAYLEGFSESDFDGWETRVVALPFMQGKQAFIGGMEIVDL